MSNERQRHEEGSAQHGEQRAGPVDERAPEAGGSPPVSLGALPGGSNTLGLRQAEALRLQRQVGNQAARRVIQRAEPEGGGGPSEIGDGSASVRAEGGQVELEASAMNVRAPVAHFDGVIDAGTVVVDNVVASNYTPGAGNVY